MSSQSADKDYWLFISYASTDIRGLDKQVDPKFERFYRKLVWEISKVKGNATPEEVDQTVFYDREMIKPGADWDNTLARALQSSKVMICLLSPSYINSTYCGKEFYAFSQRVRQYEATLRPSDPRPSVIIPILWGRPHLYTKRLPPAVTRFQYDHASYGGDYGKEGVAGLASRLRVQFDKFVEALAERICEAADDRLAPLPSLRTLADTRSAWELPPGQLSPALSLATGPRTAWFIYAAGASKDYEPFRERRDSYGGTGHEWRPYHPPGEDFINDVAPKVAEALGLKAYAASLSELPSDGLLAQLREADASNTMTVIVADPWGLQLPSVEGPLREYARARNDPAQLPNSVLVIPWNVADEETKQKRDELERKLTDIFGDTVTAADVTFHPRVETIDELRDRLWRAMREVRDKIRKRGKPARATPRPTDQFPQLNALAAAPPPPGVAP